MEHAEIDKLIDGLGITFQAEFVPQSKSRNAKPIKGISDMSLNWKVRIEKGSRCLETEYTQGIAHCPGYKQRNQSIDSFNALHFAVENGKVVNQHGTIFSAFQSIGAKPIPSPLVRDVLYSLVIDSRVLDAGTFEEWASDFGYDTDSREAERIYRACMKIALQLHAMIGGTGMQALHDAFQDY